MTESELQEFAKLKQEVYDLKQLILSFFIITDSTIKFNHTWFMCDDIREMLRELKKGELI